MMHKTQNAWTLVAFVLGIAIALHSYAPSRPAWAADDNPAADFRPLHTFHC